MVRKSIFVASAMLLSGMPAMAQTTPMAPAGNSQTIPEKESTKPLQGGRSDSLSSTLSRTGGVITPSQDADPKMHVPAPDPHPNSTPVIPPSATGGNTAK